MATSWYIIVMQLYCVTVAIAFLVHSTECENSGEKITTKIIKSIFWIFLL